MQETLKGLPKMESRLQQTPKPKFGLCWPADLLLIFLSLVPLRNPGPCHSPATVIAIGAARPAPQPALNISPSCASDIRLIYVRFSEYLALLSFFYFCCSFVLALVVLFGC
jgi:hypothetical protein